MDILQRTLLVLFSDMKTMLQEKELWSRINRYFGKAIADMDMIKAGDKILVAVSGGKDSLCMLHCFKEFQKKSPIPFEILAVNLDQRQPGFPVDVLPNLFSSWEVPFHIETKDTYSVVVDKTQKGKSYCALCSRMRRGILYQVARQHGCNKLALGHHRDDLIETFLMNALYSGQIASMSPHYYSEKENINVIRPLYQLDEKTIAAFVEAKGWPVIPCSLCGSQDGLKRQEVRALISNLEDKNSQVRNTLFGALHHSDPRFLLNKSQWADSIPVI